MADEFIRREIPRVRVALYGPSNSGKTVFCDMLIQGKVAETQPTTKPRIKEIMRDYKRKTVIGTYETATKYKLMLIDVPGKEELKEERLQSLTKIVAWIFFYDATDVKSAQALLDMIKNELEPNRSLKPAIAMIVLGTKGDLGPNPEAIKLGEEIAKHLSKRTSMLYGYNVPHFLISCMNPEDVNLAFLCVERINFELKLPDDIIARLKKKTEEYLKKSPKIGGVSETKETPIQPKEELPKAEQISEKPTKQPAEEIPMPPMPELPEGAEEKLKELKASSLAGEPQEFPMELPEQTPQPELKEESTTEELKVMGPEFGRAPPELAEIEVPIKEPSIEREKIVAPKEPTVELCREDFDWALARSLYSKMGGETRIYVVDIDRKSNKILVAYDDKSRKLEENEKMLLVRIPNIVSMSDDVTSGVYAFLVAGKERSMILMRGRKLVAMRIPTNLARKIYPLMARLRRAKQSKTITEAEIKFDAEITTTNQTDLLNLAKKLKVGLKNVLACYVILKLDGSVEVAYDGEGGLTDDQKRILRKILALDDLVEKTFGEYRSLLAYGDRSILMLKGNKGVLALIFEGTPPSSLIDLAFAAAA